MKTPSSNTTITSRQAKKLTVYQFGTNVAPVYVKHGSQIAEGLNGYVVTNLDNRLLTADMLWCWYDAEDSVGRSIGEKVAIEDICTSIHQAKRKAAAYLDVYEQLFQETPAHKLEQLGELLDIAGLLDTEWHDTLKEQVLRIVGRHAILYPLIEELALQAPRLISGTRMSFGDTGGYDGDRLGQYCLEFRLYRQDENADFSAYEVKRYNSGLRNIRKRIGKHVQKIKELLSFAERADLFDLRICLRIATADNPFGDTVYIAHDHNFARSEG